MPDSASRGLTAPARPGQLLRRILDDPALVDRVHALEPRALARLVHHVGLEDAGELVSLATTEQLLALFDDDLWRSPRPGADETFDGARFALWLEVLLEAGEELTARRLIELDEDLVSLALHHQVLVIDIDALAAEMADRGDDDDAAILEKALESCPYEELGRYRVIARRHDGWDAIVSALLSLDRDHHDFVERLLDRLAYVSRDVIEEEGGLVAVLTAGETLAQDAAGERADRRGREGYLAPSDAAAFLALARTAPVDPGAPDDPITRAYFRDYAPRPRAARASSPSSPPSNPSDRLIELLRAAGVVDAPAPLLLAAPSARSSPLRDALAELAERDPALHERRMFELHYLANALVAGCALDGRRFRPLEAAAAVVATASLGLERLGAAGASGSAVALFRAGWRVLHDEVALPARAARGAPGLDRAALDALAGDCPRLAGVLAPRSGPTFLATADDLRAAREFLRGR